MTNQILKSWNAGLVRRWHCNPVLCDTVDYDAAHTHRCVILFMQLFPDYTKEELEAVILHDQGEAAVADIGRPAKMRNPVMADMAAELEMQDIAEQGFKYPIIPEASYRKLKIVDLLDSYLWMVRNAPHLIVKDAWVAQYNMLLVQADEFNVESKLVELIHSAEELYT